MTPAEAAKAVADMDRHVIPDQAAALRVSMRGLQARIADSFRARGIGRTLARQGKPTEELIHDPIIAQQTAELVVAEVHLVGLAAIQEEGGRTRAHQIPRAPGLLSFSAFGRRVVVPEVDHPGADVKADPFATRAVAGEESDIQKGAERAAEVTAARVG